MAVAVAVVPVWAQTQVVAHDAEQGAYKQHMQNGVKLFQDKNFAAAIVEFDAAYKATPGPNPLVNIALCHKGMFNYPKAIVALETALEKHADTMLPEDKSAAEAAIQEMRSLLAFVNVTITPSNAILVIDGEEQPDGVWNKPIALSPGTHTLQAKAEGYKSLEETVTVASGDQGKKLEFHLLADKGEVNLVARDEETVIAIDQKQVGTGRWSGLVSAGAHKVQFFKQGKLVTETDILVTAGKKQSVEESSIQRKGQNSSADVQEQPSMRGFYGLVTASVFFPADSPGQDPTNTPSTQQTLSNNPGGGAGLRLGYRFGNVVGLEGMFEYRDLEGKLNEVVEANMVRAVGDYSYRSARVGFNLRLMTPARSIRFVGLVGLGVTYDWVDVSGAVRSGGPQDEKAPHLFINSETGIEFDFGGVLLGLTAQQVLQTDATNVGAGVRIGYGTW